VTHVLSYVALGLITMYAGSLLMLWHFQERILFQPPMVVDASPVSARQVHYRASDGTALFAFVVGECTPTSTVVLAFHGNAEVSRWLVPWASKLARESSACVVLAEYRGYDGLSGSPSYASSSHDARAALDFIVDSLKGSTENIILYGHSLGTAIAAELGTTFHPRALVLQAPFSSAKEMAARMIVPGLRTLFRIISRIHFDTVARVREIAAPTWVVHGDRDFVVPVRMGREVFAAAEQRGELLIVPGAGHNNVADVGGRAYWSWLVRAVRSQPAASPTLDAAAGTRSAL
jgi:pimeloyl-ACP methyl ester carboxylesterase